MNRRPRTRLVVESALGGMARRMIPPMSSRTRKDHRPSRGKAPGGEDQIPETNESHARGPLMSRTDLLVLLLLAAVCFAVFANGLKGDFVYDDTKQIVKNELIQHGRYFGKALTTDVWGFKGEKGQAWSNYWRPVFVLWLVVHCRLFGIDNTLGWHVSCVLLHAVVCGLAYLMLRRLRVQWRVALAVALLFAVHPVHVESVTWISGSGDGVLAVAMLACLLFLLDGRSTAALVCFGLALLAKEIAVFFGLIVFVVHCATQAGSRPRGERLRRAVRASVPYLVVTVIYVALHVLIIGRAQLSVPWQAGPAEILLTAPSLLFFYLRESILPLWLAPSHALRAVTPQNLGLSNFLLPAIAVGAACVIPFRLARRAPVRQIGLALFLVPLVPTLNINAFVPEQLVQDRYLYLPLLGLLMVLIPALDEWLERLGPPSRAAALTLGISAALSVPLGIGTVLYNPVWCSERALWAAAIAADPGSSYSLAEYARVMNESGREAEAKEALDKALAIRPLTVGYLQRAEIAMKAAEETADPSLRIQRLTEAEADLNLVLKAQPDNFQAYERLAVCYQNGGRLDKAEETLRIARGKVPHMKAAFTDMLAVVLYSLGRKNEALAELEGAQEQASKEFGGTASMLFFHLGSLYAEMGRTAQARVTLQQFVAFSANLRDPSTLAARTHAQALLTALPQ